METTVYRVAREALDDLAKHGSATSISITLERRSDELLAVIEDNGIGFEEAAFDATDCQSAGNLERVESYRMWHNCVSSLTSRARENRLG